MCFSIGSTRSDSDRARWRSPTKTTSEKVGIDTLVPLSNYLGWLDDGPPLRILELGCGDGRFGEALRLAGHTVTGLDDQKLDGVADRLDRFVEADLSHGLPADIGEDFDVVIASDVFEHLVNPAGLLSSLRDVLAPRGVVMASIPNIAHWYPRSAHRHGTLRLRPERYFRTSIT